MAQSALRCIAPSEITDTDMIEYTHGEAPAAVADHIGRCDHCRSQARDYARIERVLHAHLYRRTCPDALTLGEYALGLLPSERLLSIAEHLVECPHCAAECRDYSRFLSEPDEPPAERGLIAAIRRLIAVPLAAPEPLGVGLRGSGPGDSVTYAAEDIQVFVSVQRATRGGGFVLAGLLQTADLTIPAGAQARLYDGDRLLRTEPIDDLGAFLFDGVPAGVYRVEVQLADAIVELAAVPTA